MNKQVIGVGLAAVVGMTVLAWASGDPAPDKAPDKVQDKPAAKGVAGNPFGNSPAYEVLRQKVGTWDVEMSMTLQPGADPIKTTCTATNTMALGGLFLEQRMTGGKLAMPGMDGGMAIETISLVGYDPGSKKYTATRFSSTSPVPMSSVGEYDAEKGVFTFVGESKQVYMQIKYRDVITAKSDDETLVESYMSFNNSPEWKGIEMVWKRRK